MNHPLWVTYTQPHNQRKVLRQFFIRASNCQCTKCGWCGYYFFEVPTPYRPPLTRAGPTHSRIRLKGRHRMSVHSSQKVHRLEVINRRTPPAGAERLVVPPIELQHTINVLEPYIWHDWLCRSTNSSASPWGSSTTDFPQTWQ